MKILNLDPVWVLFSLVIIVALIAFVRYFLFPQWKQKAVKQLSPEEIENVYENEKEIIKEKIHQAENQWQLDKTAYLICRFSAKYKLVKDWMTVQDDTIILASLWQNKEKTFEAPTAFYSN